MNLIYRLLTIATAAFMAVACEKPENQDKPTEPPVPGNVTLHGSTETSLTFQWALADGAESYQWRLTCATEDPREGNTDKRNVTVSGLTPGTAYSFTVRATSGTQSSPWSQPLDITTSSPQVPVPSGNTKCVDAPLILDLDSTPTLGSSGRIAIFTKDGKQVDQIDMADVMKVKLRDDGNMVPASTIDNNASFHSFMDALPCSGKWRAVHYTPVRVGVKKLIIQPHTGVLDFNTEYYVTIDAGVINGFQGTGEGEWTFATGPAPKSAAELSVAADGTGDFCTIQRALDYADKNGCTISISNGTYRELLFARDKSNITLKGESRGGVNVIYPNNESYESGSGGSIPSRPQSGSSIGKSGGRGLFLVENCDNLVIQDLTIENSFGEQKGQAETIYFNSGSNAHRLTIENCSLISFQDTFLCKGKVWVHNSLIAGHVDFIWGYPAACLFEDCEIRARAAGYIVQARAQSASDKGFVFLNCKLTAEDGVKDGVMYLARSAGQADCFDNVTFIGCTMASVIAPEGWNNKVTPNPSTPTAASGWKEYGSVTPSGTPATGSRNKLGLVLTAEQAAAYSSRSAVLGW